MTLGGRFVLAPDGTLDFGEVPAESGRQAGKIRLREGDERAGARHIELRHGEQIRRRGFASVASFVHYVAQHYSEIYQVKRPNSRGLELVVYASNGGRLVVQTEPHADGDFYDVKTANPVRDDQYKNTKPLWVRTGTSATSAEADPLFPGAKAVLSSLGADAAESKLPAERVPAIDTAARQTATAAFAHHHPRILIVRVGAMGDVLHGLPAVAALRQALPEAFLGWAVEPRWASLLQSTADAEPGTPAMPLVDLVHPVETRLWSKRPLSLDTLRSVLRLRSGLRQRRYDLAIDLQGSIRSAVIARLSGAKIIAGNTAPREDAAKYFYAVRVQTTSPHVVQQAAEIASAALLRLAPGASAPAATRPALPWDAEAEAWCDRLLADNPRPVVFLAPTAGWGAKEWPPDRFGALAARMQASGYRVLVNAVGGDDPVADRVVAAAARAGALPPEAVSSTLPQLTALLRRVALVIAGDTGPLHLAAALGRPTVGLFGPTDPARNGPFGNPARVLRDASSVTDHRRHAATEPGLLRIDVETVAAAAEKMLSSGA